MESYGPHLRSINMVWWKVGNEVIEIRSFNEVIWKCILRYKQISSEGFLTLAYLMGVYFKNLISINLRIRKYAYMCACVCVKERERYSDIYGGRVWGRRGMGGKGGRDRGSEPERRKRQGQGDRPTDQQGWNIKIPPLRGGNYHN